MKEGLMTKKFFISGLVVVFVLFLSNSSLLLAQDYSRPLLESEKKFAEYLDAAFGTDFYAPFCHRGAGARFNFGLDNNDNIAWGILLYGEYGLSGKRVVSQAELAGFALFEYGSEGGGSIDVLGFLLGVKGETDMLASRRALKDVNNIMQAFGWHAGLGYTRTSGVTLTEGALVTNIGSNYFTGNFNFAWMFNLDITITLYDIIICDFDFYLDFFFGLKIGESLFAVFRPGIKYTLRVNEFISISTISPHVYIGLNKFFNLDIFISINIDFESTFFGVRAGFYFGF